MTKKQESPNPIEYELQTAAGHVAGLESIIATLSEFKEKTAATIAKYLRMDGGAEINPDAIRATVERPYTVLPINEHEAWLIHWRGINMPIFGWVVAQEPAFIKSKVSRSMDLLTPMPEYLKKEMGWKAPEHKAIIDGTRTGIRVTDGDEATFRKKYGAHLGKRGADGSYAIKGGDAWIKLVASLVRDGILPYTPQPVAKENINTNAEYSDLLFELIQKKQKQAGDDYIMRARAEFFGKGAILVNYPPGSGKTLTTCAILTHFVGRVLILGDSVMLVDQWRDRVKALAPNTAAKITFSTYQGAAKYLNEEWDLIVPDEAQRLAANTFSKLAFAKTKYRLGLSGTPWREDGRQHLIVALSGFPVAIRWASLVSSGALRKPSITVATVPSEAAKPAFVKKLLTGHVGRAVVYCDWIEQGQQLADYLKVPFIHGGTLHKLERVKEAEVCVVSRIGDRGLSLPDIRLVIEVAGAGAAREQFAQRVGRLLHGEFTGKFVTVFSPEEAAKYRARVFGVEAELAGEVDIEFINVGDVAERPASKTARAVIARPGPRNILGQGSRANPKKSEYKPSPQPSDEISQVLSIPSVWMKVQTAQKTAGSDAAPYVVKVLRFCWDLDLSVIDIAEGRGLSGKNAQGRLKAALGACVKAGLMIHKPGDRFTVNHETITRLQSLNKKLKGN